MTNTSSVPTHAAQEPRAVIPKFAFPPTRTWLSLVTCIIFQLIVAFLCFHPNGVAFAKRGPTLIARWLKRSSPPRNGGEYENGGNSQQEVHLPSTLAQSWRLGALHEKFFHGRDGSEATLLEVGEVLGLGRAVTEVNVKTRNDYCMCAMLSTTTRFGEGSR